MLSVSRSIEPTVDIFSGFFFFSSAQLDVRGGSQRANALLKAPMSLFLSPHNMILSRYSDIEGSPCIKRAHCN